jgi:hypothetical protein
MLGTSPNQPSKRKEQDMAKWKEGASIAPAENAVALTVDPRVRMKEIRQMVNNHLKGKAVSEDLGHLKYLADLPETMEDARRVIHALNDLLDKETDKHRKATHRICDMNHALMALSEATMHSLMACMERDSKIATLRNDLQEEREFSDQLQDQRHQATHERDAVLTTMKLLNQPERQEYSGKNPVFAAFSNTYGRI